MATYQAGEKINYSYTGAAQWVELPAGEYLLEAWGAQGGSRGTTAGVGGKGAYAKGTLKLMVETSIAIMVGGAGASAGNSTSLTGGGFNGGGKASYYGGTGGGATDFRLGEGSLTDRILVAAGGGGAQGRNSASYRADGGHGGATVGGDGGYYNGSATTTYNGKGATQSTGGAAGVYPSKPASEGSLGEGGDAGLHGSTTYCGNGGGGGGYYGGGGGAYRYAAGGGGSSWVAASLSGSQLIAGNASMILPSGGTATGNSGNGAARITVITPAPATPSGLTASGVTSNRVVLSWNGVSGATGYYVYRDGVKVTPTPVTATSYQDTGLAAGGSYRYTVSAINGGYEGSESAELQVTTEKARELKILTVEVVPNPVVMNGEFHISVQAAEIEIILANVSPFAGSFSSGQEMKLAVQAEVEN